MLSREQTELNGIVDGGGIDARRGWPRGVGGGGEASSPFPLPPGLLSPQTLPPPANRLPRSLQ